MATTQFAVVYGIASKTVRRIVENDVDDSHIAMATANLSPGESILVLNISDFPVRNIPTMGPALCTRLGAVSVRPMRSVAILGGTVHHASMADPAIDTVPNMTLVAHDGADIGDLWDGTSFRRRFVMVDEQGNLATPFPLNAFDRDGPVPFAHPMF